MVEKITDGVYYVGVNDRTTTRFEGLWPLPYGVTYNSYIVRGSEKTALIEGVEISQCLKQIEKIKEIDPAIHIDYLVIDHMEPDHSGAILALKYAFPDIQIIGNAKTAGMVEGYYGISDGIITVNEGDCIDLGGKTLKFFMTPMIHWPETMMTYAVEDKVLFSGDAFGCFGALNGGIIDSEMDTTAYFPEMIRYYSNIVAKYGIFVQKALAKFKGTEIHYICSTHGPVWHSQIGKVVGIYDRLSRNESKEGVVIAYASMYGNTEEMVETIARAIASQGIRNITIHNVSYSDESDILRDIYTYKGLIIATPTYNGNTFPKIESLLSSLQLRNTSNKVFACAGSYTWAPAGVKKIKSICEKLSFTHVDLSVEMKQGMSKKIEDECIIFGKQFAETLKAECQNAPSQNIG